MATPETDPRAPPVERQTLSERMAQARERTVAARVERGVNTTSLPAVTQALQAPKATPPVQPAQPMLSIAPARQMPLTAATGATGPTLAPAVHTPSRTGSNSWEVRARPGESVMLMPGQMHFGGDASVVRTLLGSCVAVTLWHPAKRIGGMCHYLLPARTRRSGEALEGKYGDEALEAMVARLRQARTEPGEYEAHLYGGADTMAEITGVKFNIGERNIEQGWTLVDRYGFQLQGVDVGEDVPRTVTLNCADGSVDMRRGNSKAAPIPTPRAPATSGGKPRKA